MSSNGAGSMGRRIKKTNVGGALHKLRVELSSLVAYRVLCTGPSRSVEMFLLKGIELRESTGHAGMC